MIRARLGLILICTFSSSVAADTTPQRRAGFTFGDILLEKNQDEYTGLRARALRVSARVRCSREKMIIVPRGFMHAH